MAVNAPRPYKLGARAESMRQTREAIVAAARALFQRSGYHDVSIDELAAEAEVGRATVYKHFATKAELLTAVMENLVTGADIHRIREARQDPDPVKALRGFIAQTCRMYADMGASGRRARAAAWTDDEASAVADATYYAGRRSAVTELVARLATEHGLAKGVTRARAIDSVLVLTDYEAYYTLTHAQGRTPAQAARVLSDLALSLLRPR